MHFYDLRIHNLLRTLRPDLLHLINDNGGHTSKIRDYENMLMQVYFYIRNIENKNKI